MLEIKTGRIRDCRITIPGSKSHTHRALVIAALVEDESTILNGLRSEDTDLTADALDQMGVKIRRDTVAKWRVVGTGGRFLPSKQPIYLGNSGTSMRLLTALAALGNCPYTLKGTDRMHERPIENLLQGLRQTGAQAISINNNKCPPVLIDGKNQSGGHVDLDCSDSSQYLSAMLMIGPYLSQGLEINVFKGPVSRPYVDMTLAVMKQFGVDVARNGYQSFSIKGNCAYRPTAVSIEPDASNASYFFAAAAISGATLTVNHIKEDSLQGDVRFIEVLEKMGCEIHKFDDGIAISGKRLNGVEVDMSSMPDMVPTLAVTAAFAAGKTHIKGIGHLKVKECDRILAVTTELGKMGIRVEASENHMTVHGGRPHGATIDTYNDHRIAMSFAVAGLVVPGIVIQNEGCVEKSFPSFWKIFKRIYS